MKRFLSISVLLQAATGLMTAVLAAIFAISAIGALAMEEQARRVPPLVDISNDLFAGIQSLRLERGLLSTTLVTPKSVERETESEIAALRSRSGGALDSALAKLSAVTPAGADSAIQNMRANRLALDKLRHEADAALKQPEEQRPTDLSPRWIAAADGLVGAIDRLSALLEGELSQGDSFVANMIRIKQIVWSVRSNSGDDRLLIAQAIARAERLSPESQRQLTILAGRVEGAWRIVHDQGVSAEAPPKLKEAIAATDRIYFAEFRPLREAVLEDLAAGRPVAISAREWLRRTDAGQRSIFTVANVALGLASEHAIDRVIAADRNFQVAMLFMVLFSSIGAATSLYVFRGVVRPIARIAETMRVVAKGDLACEIPFEQRPGEIGYLARALRVFRDNAIEKQRLRVEKEGAEAANRSKSEFLAHMSHELRTPLNAVIGFAEMIKLEMFGPAGDRYRGYAVNIFDSGNHLLGLINDILDLSKLEAGELQLEEEEVDLSQLAQACIQIVAPQAARAKVRLYASVSQTLPHIRGDDRRLRQVLLNLLSNAVKFTPEGGQVRVSGFRKDGDIAIVVSDTGIGMAPEDIPKALKSFGQVDSALSRKYEGTGLGLPLAKHLVSLHGGSLTIESRVNIGTTVTAILPGERIIDVRARVPASNWVRPAASA